MRPRKKEFRVEKIIDELVAQGYEVSGTRGVFSPNEPRWFRLL